MSGWTRVAELLDAAPGDYAACVVNAEREIAFAYAADTVMPAASLIKVPLAMALVASGAGGAGEAASDLRTTVTLREEDRVEGVGAFDNAPAGTTRTLWELIGYALRESDNTAANLLIQAIGMDCVNRFLRSAPRNLPLTRLQRRFMDLDAAARGNDNQTTAREMCILFHELLAPDRRYAGLVDYLAASPYDDKLVAGVPPGVGVAHKVGDLPGVEHDVGIVYAARQLYIVALLSADLPDAETGKRTLAKASRLIYDQMRGRQGG